MESEKTLHLCEELVEALSGSLFTKWPEARPVWYKRKLMKGEQKAVWRALEERRAFMALQWLKKL